MLTGRALEYIGAAPSAEIHCGLAIRAFLELSDEAHGGRADIAARRFIPLNPGRLSSEDAQYVTRVAAARLRPFGSRGFVSVELSRDDLRTMLHLSLDFALRRNISRRKTFDIDRNDAVAS